MTTLLSAATATTSAGSTQLIFAALVGIAAIVLMITQLKLHPFLSLTIGSIAVGALAGMHMDDTLVSFGTGVGATVASVGTLIALGAMFGRLLADSGGADQIVDTIVGRSSARTLPWAMALVGALIGLPMFFEIGLVLLMPVIVLVSRRTQLPLLRVGIPALAGLSVMHGLVPPHPGPLVAVAALNANLGITIALGVLVAIPTVAFAGPFFARYAARWVPAVAPAMTATVAPAMAATSVGAPVGGWSQSSGGSDVLAGQTDAARRRPKFTTTLFTVLLPVVLMMGKALADIFASKGPVLSALNFLGTPLVALLLSVLVAMVTFGRGSGMSPFTLIPLDRSYGRFEGWMPC